MSEKEEAVSYSAEWEMIRSYQELLLSVASSRIQPKFRARLDPADVVQNALFQAFRALRKGSRPNDLKHWLLDILGKKIIDAVRQCTAQQRDINREAPANEVGATTSDLAWLAGEITSPSEGAVRNERMELIRDAILTLSLKQQEVVHLYLEGLSTKQIASKMDLTERAVAGQLWRAVQRVAALVNPYRDTEGDLPS